MIAVVQRVREAEVRVGDRSVAAIGPGLLLLVGVAEGDGRSDAEALASRVARARLFADDAGKMGRTLTEAGGRALAVSQFTLLGDFSRGNRPSFHRAARPETARPIFDGFVAALARELGREVPAGVFGADMEVRLVNDGPATFVLDTRA